MLYISLIALIIGIILSIKSLIRKQSEVGVLQMLFTTSITIITSSFPNFWNNIIAIIALLKNQPDIVYNSLEFNYISFIFGIILLIFLDATWLQNLFLEVNHHFYLFPDNKSPSEQWRIYLIHKKSFHLLPSIL